MNEYVETLCSLIPSLETFEAINRKPCLEKCTNSHTIKSFLIIPLMECTPQQRRNDMMILGRKKLRIPHRIAHSNFSHSFKLNAMK